MIPQRFTSELIVNENASPNTSTLIFSGELTIQDAKALKEILLEALAKSDICLLDLKTVYQCDLAGLQILYAAFKSAVAQNKTLSLTSECSNSFAKAVSDAGFDSIRWLGFGEGKQ